MKEKADNKLAFSGEEICFCSCASSFITKHFSIINILIFQTTGIAFLSYCILIFGGILGFPGSLITIFAMFVCFLWTGRMTGPFLNPALVISCMIKKQKSIPIIKGLFYILAQVIGAFIGTFIAWSIQGNLTAPLQFYSTSDAEIYSFLRSIIGTFIYCTLILILVSSDTTCVQMEIQIWFAIPLILVGVCGLLNLPLGVNPAMSLSYQVVWGIHNKDFSQMVYCWTFIVGPIIGSIFAGTFFEFVFRKFILAYKAELKRQQELFQRRMNTSEKKKKKNRISQIELV